MIVPRETIVGAKRRPRIRCENCDAGEYVAILVLAYAGDERATMRCDWCRWIEHVERSRTWTAMWDATGRNTVDQRRETVVQHVDSPVEWVP